MTISQDELKTLVELEKKATQGPWIARELHCDGHESFLQGNEVAGKSMLGDYYREILSDENYDKKNSDIEFIAAIRNAAPRLLAEIARLQDIEKIAVEALEHYECAHYEEDGKKCDHDSTALEALIKIKSITDNKEK